MDWVFYLVAVMGVVVTLYRVKKQVKNPYPPMGYGDPFDREARESDYFARQPPDSGGNI